MPFGFYSKGTIIIPPMPKWPEVATPVANIAAFQQAIRKHSPACRFGDLKDGAYMAVPVAALRLAIDWTLRALKEQGIVYTPESWDCENFVNEADQTLRKMAMRAGLKASPLTCCFTVNLSVEWAGVAPGRSHALMGTLTDSGVFVSESQNGQSCPIEVYPNRSGIAVADNF